MFCDSLNNTEGAVMSLLPCSRCGEKISLEVQICPQCKNRDPFELERFSPLFVFIIWVLAICLAVSFSFVLFFSSQNDLFISL